MGYTQTDIDTLKAAIATGAKEVQFGAGPDSRRVVYRSLGDMYRALADMQNEVTPAAAPTLRTVGQVNSGFSFPYYPGHWNRN